MKNERRYDLDWLRVIAFYLLIIYHTALIFVSWEFHIKNKQISEIAEPFLIFLNQWRLPLLFLISGIGVRFALKHRVPKVFIKERSTRLMIPLLFGMFVIVPPQIYFEHLQNSVDYSSYFDFYKTVFNFVAYPEGSFSWHHLWFLPYLFSYSVIGL
ncbi:MAG: acyltransferase family protein, partial [Ignavibacteriae bacterium]|nr:acyltransferase family protein [Ignavibacteriota bacterium]